MNHIVNMIHIANSIRFNNSKWCMSLDCCSCVSMGLHEDRRKHSCRGCVAHFRLTDFLGAGTTPEAVVVDGSGHTVYSGAIDNRAADLGQRRIVITEHYLADALDSVVKGQPVKVKKTNAVGCFIERL